jgi:hypothetical protein
MKEIITYIHYLLHEEGKAVLPELGTLSAHYQPAAADLTKGRFTPPAHRLQFNDILEDASTTIRQISTLAAKQEKQVKQALEEYARKLKNELEHEGVAVLDGLGKLRQNRSGQLRFEADPEFNSQGNAFGLETFQLSKPSPKAAEQKKTMSALAKEAKQPKSAAPSKEKKERKTGTAMLTVLTSLIILALSAYLGYAFFFDPPAHISRYMTPLPLPEKEAFAPTFDSTERTRDEVSLSRVDSIPRAEDSFRASSASIPTPITDSIVDRQVEAEPEKMREEGKIEKYFVVAGLFKTDKGVSQTIRQLNDKGYPAKVFRTNARGIHYVCYAAYPDKASAEEALQKIRESEDQQAWIWPQNH